MDASSGGAEEVMTQNSGEGDIPVPEPVQEPVEEDKGRMLMDAINSNASLHPDLMMEQLIKDFKLAADLYGERILRLFTGYPKDYISKNLNIPEFRKEISKKMKQKAQELKEENLLDKRYGITNEGLEAAAHALLVEELNNIAPKGFFGERDAETISPYGQQTDAAIYKRGDRYKDIALKKSIKVALRRGHTTLGVEDLRTYRRSAKGKACIIYALDASGSMRGKKLEQAKKAGVALAFKAIQNRDDVGFIAFSSLVKGKVTPTNNFQTILHALAKTRAGQQTDFTQCLKEALTLFPAEDMTKHLIFISDAMPTVGEKPEEDALKEVLQAVGKGITISMIGINLQDETKNFAQTFARYGRGRCIHAKKLDELDHVVLEDYEMARG